MGAKITGATVALSMGTVAPDILAPIIFALVTFAPIISFAPVLILLPRFHTATTSIARTYYVPL